MSGDSRELRNAALIIAPHWKLTNVLNVTNVAASQDLGVLGPTTRDVSDLLRDIIAPTERAQGPGLLNRYVRFKAIGTTVGIIFGAAVGEVTGGNVPVLAATGATQVNGSAANASGLCYQLLPGDKEDYWISTSVRFLGFIGAGNGQLIVCPSSLGGEGG